MTSGAGAAIVVLAVLLVSGCRLDADVAVDVDGNGAGQLEVTLATDDELRRAAADADADPLAVLADEVGTLDGWSVRRQDADRVTVVTRFDDPRELARVTADFAAGLAGPELTPLGPLRVTVTDDAVSVRGTVDLRVRDTVDELGLAPAAARSVLADAVRMDVVVRMPGDIVAANADRRPAPDTATWRVDAGSTQVLRVRSQRPWTVDRVIDVLSGPPGIVALVTLGALVALVTIGWRRYAAARSARMRSRSDRT